MEEPFYDHSSFLCWWLQPCGSFRGWGLGEGAEAASLGSTTPLSIICFPTHCAHGLPFGCFPRGPDACTFWHFQSTTPQEELALPHLGSHGILGPASHWLPLSPSSSIHFSPALGLFSCVLPCSIGDLSREPVTARLECTLSFPLPYLLSKHVRLAFQPWKFSGSHCSCPKWKLQCLCREIPHSPAT